MATIHPIEANRPAKKSPGARSALRKTASFRNALKSGIDAKSLVIRGEEPADLEALTAEYSDRFQPVTPEERFFVDTLIRGDWQLRRLAKADAQIWEHEITSLFHPESDAPLGHAFELGARHFERLQRRLAATERSYTSALHELERLQSARDTEPDAKPIPGPTPLARWEA